MVAEFELFKTQSMKFLSRPEFEKNFKSNTSFFFKNSLFAKAAMA